MAKTSRRGTRSQVSRSVSPRQKAEWHHVTGAGRSHVLRPFFGISPSDAAVIERDLGLRLDLNLQRGDTRI